MEKTDPFPGLAKAKHNQKYPPRVAMMHKGGQQPPWRTRALHARYIYIYCYICMHIYLYVHISVHATFIYACIFIAIQLYAQII